MRKIKEIRNNWNVLLPYVLLVIGWLVMVWYLAVPGKALVDSDMAGEMILADLLNKEGRIVTDSWCYSTEFRVINLQWFFRLGLLLFPHNWHMARTVSTALLMIVMLLAYLYLANQAGCKNHGAWSALALIWPMSQWYLFIGLSSGFYLIYISFSCLILGLIFSQVRNGQESSALRNLFRVTAIVLLSFGTGLNGIKQILTFFAPVALASLFALFFKASKRDSDCAKERKIFLYCLLASVASFAGYLVNALYYAPRYHFYAFETKEWMKPLSITALLEYWSDVLSLFGYHSGTKVFGFNGIASALGLLVAVIFLVILFRLIQSYQNLETEKAIIFLTSVSGLFVCGFAFTLLYAYQICYWLPLLPFWLLLFQLMGEEIKVGKVRKLTAVLFGFAVIVISVGAIRYEISNPSRGDYEMQSVVQQIQAKGYTQGYATFWNSDVLTEMSSGELESWTILEFDTFSMRGWLEKREHLTVKPSGRTFVMMNLKSDEVSEERKAYLLELADDIIVANENFLVLGYQDGTCLP